MYNQRTLLSLAIVGRRKMPSAQPSSSMLALPLSRVREQGVQVAATQAVAHFAGREFWVHPDADVLDPQHMLAVDSPDPGGMSPDELRSNLKVALAARNCIGMQVTIYDPTLDDTGDGAVLLVDLLAESVGSRAK
jgi:arginase